MENATKRIRKGRRQGLQRGKDLGLPSRVRYGGRGKIAGRDLPSEPRPNERRDELVTRRKAKRHRRTGIRRAAKRPRIPT